MGAWVDYHIAEFMGVMTNEDGLSIGCFNALTRM